ncbi:MAG: helicase [Polyangiaceae bacterium]|nr:helicase [Polyangiaceae bacterium]
MLEHPTGMIGLPLRLLAREVYDRITTEAGEARVALVTGEEKRIPANARYFVATVEAMPLDRSVDFLAVDEVQLAAHPERGHVFTERVLSARGRSETWLLGSPSMQTALSKLIPGATTSQRPRLSTLRYAGPATLSNLPRRSAVVAFSWNRVYELAERLREKRGGAAIVLGALSPRTRNAQVAMYQAGEVDHVVATDAIGMGLNLDLSHVAFADLRKFDGREVRDLDIGEMAQIAGRAGRYVRDGTFGTLAPLGPLSDRVVRALEKHDVPRVERLFWRSGALDTSSLDALLESLRAPSPDPLLRRVDAPDDERALLALAARRDVRDRATTEDRVRLLWEVCALPDYKKLLFEDHIEVLARLYLDLTGPRARIDPDWTSRELSRIARPAEDIDTLMFRLAEVRLFAYAANQPGWTDERAGIGERTRAIEDALSDRLHELLVARFVTIKKRTSVAKVPRAEPSNPFAALERLREKVGGSDVDDVGSSTKRIESIVEATHDRFRVDRSGAIACDGSAVGRFKPGKTLDAPEVQVTLDVEAGARLRVSRRLLAFSRDLAAELGGELRDLEGLSPSGRGVAHVIARGLGTALVAPLGVQLSSLSDEERAIFTRAGVVLGRVVLYVPRLVKPHMIERRVALAAAFFHVEIKWPTGREVSVARRTSVSDDAYLAVGYVPIEGIAIRADVLERVLGKLKGLEEPPQPAALASWLGCRPADAARVLPRLTQL